MSLSSVELGEMVGLLAALAWSATVLLVRAHGAHIHAIVINALRLGISGGVFLLAWPFLSPRQPVPSAAWLFLGTSILPSGNTNYSLVGLTPAMAKKLHLTGHVTGIPSVDADINKCNAVTPRVLTAGGIDPRVACWAAVDKKLMTQVVPWVPYLSANNNHVTGPTVSKWEYDQFGDATGYAHVAVK